MQRPARPERAKASASERVSSPASIPTPRPSRCSHSSTMAGSPWLAVTSSGNSVQAATSSSLLPGSASMSAEVLSEIGTPGHAARTARNAAAHGSAASVSRPASS